MPRRRSSGPALIAASLLCAGCAVFPPSRGAGLAAEPYPQLLPIDHLLAEADTPLNDPAPGLSARAARLKARAAALGAP